MKKQVFTWTDELVDYWYKTDTKEIYKKMIKKNKIYIVVAGKSEHDLELAYCSTYTKAKEKHLKIVENIHNIKTYYFVEFDSDFDKDEEYIDSWENEGDEKYYEIERRLTLYKAKYPELEYLSIRIEEKELL